MVIKNKISDWSQFCLHDKYKRIYCKYFITQALSGPLSRSNDPPLTVLVTGYCLKRGACSSGLLQAWHAALVFKRDDPKKSWQQCCNRQGQHPSWSSKSKLFFSSCKEQHQRIKRTAAEQTELNFWSPAHHDMMTLSDLNLCLFYPSTKRRPLSPEASTK